MKSTLSSPIITGSNTNTNKPLSKLIDEPNSNSNATLNFVSSGSLPSHLDSYLQKTPSLESNQPSLIQKHNLLVILNALALSPDKAMVVVAGRELFKVFALSNENKIKEIINMRLGCRLNQNFNINDVKWCQHYAKGLIATAATNGSIVLWNINKSGPKIERTITEHSRSVNRVSFHPTEPYLLSASQDGTMKLWDLRTKASSKQTFEGKAESVRDIQFSPTHSHAFASVFETGIVQKWDIRYPAAPEKRFTAHNGIAITLDYHPNGRYFATGGRDKQVKVWDILEDTRKPCHLIQTIAPVNRVVWRPTTSDQFQLTVTALQSDFRIHLFDLHRPCLPMYSFQSSYHHSNLITGLAWKNESQVWSCSKDKTLMCSHLDSAHSILNDLPTSAIAWHPSGSIYAVLDPEPSSNVTKKWAPIQTVGHPTPNTSTTTSTSMTLAKHTHSIVNPPSDLKNGIGGYESEVYESSKPNFTPNSMFLRKSSLKKAEKHTIESMLPIYQPHQIAFSLDPHYFDPHSFTYLANHYRLDSSDMAFSCQSNAALALSVNLQELNQVWLMVHLLLLSSFSFPSSTLPTTPRSSNSNPCDSYSIPFPPTDNVDLNPCVSILNHLLDYFTLQGDVQFCCTLYLLLDPSIRQQLDVSEPCKEQWFLSYLELLQRFKLFDVATTIIHLCPIKSFAKKLQESTTIHLQCPHCSKVILSPFKLGLPTCDRCLKLINPCSFCHRPVQGLYSWCQVCGHGGHITCLINWFQHHEECCLGCGHRCIV